MRTAVAVSAAILLACHPQTAKTAGSSAQVAADTLRGILVIEGSDPFPIVAMRTSEGRVLIDSASTGMLKLAQLELWLSGQRTSADRFQVKSYRVRGANGV
jgi:hypothetical protein